MRMRWQMIRTDGTTVEDQEMVCGAKDIVAGIHEGLYVRDTIAGRPRRRGDRTTIPQDRLWHRLAHERTVIKQRQGAIGMENTPQEIHHALHDDHQLRTLLPCLRNQGEHIEIIHQHLHVVEGASLIMTTILEDLLTRLLDEEAKPLAQPLGRFLAPKEGACKDQGSAILDQMVAGDVIFEILPQNTSLALQRSQETISH